MTTEIFWMEVRDAGSAGNLLGWLAVPLSVYQGDAGSSHTFIVRRPITGRFVHTVTLPIRQYAAPSGVRWAAFAANTEAQKLLPNIAGFRRCGP